MAASIIVQTADCQWVSGYVLCTDLCSELLGEGTHCDRDAQASSGREVEAETNQPVCGSTSEKTALTTHPAPLSFTLSCPPSSLSTLSPLPQPNNSHLRLDKWPWEMTHKTSWSNCGPPCLILANDVLWGNANGDKPFLHSCYVKWNRMGGHGAGTLQPPWGHEDLRRGPSPC